LPTNSKPLAFQKTRRAVLADKFRSMASDHLVTKEYLDYKLSNLGLQALLPENIR
jgi:hypothetical protein